MDYSDDACMNTFTYDQRERMQAAVYSTRASLLSSKGGVPPESTSNGGGSIGGGSCPPLHSGYGKEENFCSTEAYRPGQCATLVNENFSSFDLDVTRKSRGWGRAFGNPYIRNHSTLGEVMFLGAANVLECGSPDGIFWKNTNNFDAGVEYSVEFDMSAGGGECSNTKLFFYLAKDLRSSAPYAVGPNNGHQKSSIGSIYLNKCSTCFPISSEPKRAKFNFTPSSSNYDQLLLFLVTNTSSSIYIDNFVVKEGASVQVENEVTVSGAFSEGFNNSNSPFFARNAILSGGSTQNLHIESGANFTVYGTQEILIKPGFIARAGSDFVAKMVPEPDPCAGARLTSNSNAKKLPYDSSSSVATSTSVYPNPFENDITVSYSIKARTTVDLAVFDLAGHQTAHFIDHRVQEPGSYQMKFNTQRLSTGIYVYKLTVGDYETQGKIIKQ